MNNIFKWVADEFPAELTELLVDSGTVKIERIISKGQKLPETGWFDQARNEWVMVLQGEAVLTFADESSQRFTPGDYINIMAHEKHNLAGQTRLLKPSGWRYITDACR